MFAASPVNGLLLVVCGQHPKYYSFTVFNANIGYAIGYRITNEIKMFGLTLYHTTQTDHRIQIFVFL
ncbi:hypothetical protein D3C86_1721660 [compost metagenome]